MIAGDLANPSDVASALEGVDAALLVTPNTQAQLDMERNFAQTAASAGVRHLVKVSSIEASENVQEAFPRNHFLSEEFVRSLDLRSTILRPSFYMQNLLLYAQSIAETNAFTLPLGDTKTGMIDAADVGEIAANCLLDQGEDSATWHLSGPELLNFDQVAESMSRALGRKITYQRQPMADFAAFMRKIVTNEWHANAVCEAFEAIAEGSLTMMTEEAGQLLGRKPNSVEDFTRNHAKAFAAT